MTGEGLPLRRKGDNKHDEHLVAIINNGGVVHVACSSLFFLKRGEDVYTVCNASQCWEKVVRNGVVFIMTKP